MAITHGLLQGFLSWLPDSWTALTAADSLALDLLEKDIVDILTNFHRSDIINAAFFNYTSPTPIHPDLQSDRAPLSIL